MLYSNHDDAIYDTVCVKDAQKFREVFENAKKIMTSRLQNDSSGMNVDV